MIAYTSAASDAESEFRRGKNTSVYEYFTQPNMSPQSSSSRKINSHLSMKVNTLGDLSTCTSGNSRYKFEICENIFSMTSSEG